MVSELISMYLILKNYRGACPQTHLAYTLVSMHSGHIGGPVSYRNFHTNVGLSAYQRGSFDTHLSPQQPEGSCLHVLIHLYQILSVTSQSLYGSGHNHIHEGHPHIPHSVFYVTLEFDTLQIYNQLQKVLVIWYIFLNSEI